MSVFLLVFITTQYSTNLLLKILSFVLPVLFCIVNYCTFIIRADSVKQMMEQNRDNWRIFEDKLEIDIIKKYSYIARLLTIIVMGFCCFLLIMHTILQFLPFILDIILPLNESRFYQPFFITEYFVNQEKYMYAILLHCVLAVNVGIIAVCSVSITILTYILHTCALLNIASYRIENAIEWSMLAISSPTREYLLYWRIVDGITIHRRAIEFTKFLSSKFTVLFAILIVIGVSSISLNLFQFLHLVTMNTNNITEILMCVLLLIALFTYMFSANYAGQVLTDHGIKLFKATYNGIWYAAPLHTQKMLLFIMQIGMVNINLGCGSVFTASVEGFATLLNAAVSYCTMMYSTRQ